MNKIDRVSPIVSAMLEDGVPDKRIVERLVAGIGVTDETGDVIALPHDSAAALIKGCREGCGTRVWKRTPHDEYRGTYYWVAHLDTNGWPERIEPNSSSINSVEKDVQEAGLDAPVVLIAGDRLIEITPKLLPFHKSFMDSP